MAKLPPKQEAGNDQEWLNTYADMVTLLLTFFVLLFACSNLDETKMQYIFQAFQMRGKYINPVVDQQPNDPSMEANGGNTETPNNMGGDGTMPESFEELYQYLADYVDNNNLADMVALENGAAYFTMRFNSSVFFDADSHLLKADGRQLLDDISPAIWAVRSSFKTVTVTGHTSTGNSNISDWTLSSNRAASVVNYLTDPNNTRRMVEDEKYRTRGCGNTEPAFPNNTIEGRRQNRRVELVMLKSDLDYTDPDVIKDIFKHDFHMDVDQFDPNNPDAGKEYTTLPDGNVDKIIAFIEDKYSNNGMTHIGTMGPSAVDGSMFISADEAEGDDGGADAGGEE